MAKDTRPLSLAQVRAMTNPELLELAANHVDGTQRLRATLELSKREANKPHTSRNLKRFLEDES